MSTRTGWRAARIRRWSVGSNTFLEGHTLKHAGNPYEELISPTDLRPKHARYALGLWPACTFSKDCPTTTHPNMMSASPTGAANSSTGAGVVPPMMKMTTSSGAMNHNAHTPQRGKRAALPVLTAVTTRAGVRLRNPKPKLTIGSHAKDPAHLRAGPEVQSARQSQQRGKTAKTQQGKRRPYTANRHPTVLMYPNKTKTSQRKTDRDRAEEPRHHAGTPISRRREDQEPQEMRAALSGLRKTSGASWRPLRSHLAGRRINASTWNRAGENGSGRIWTVL